jgi:hypothetical protein
MASEDMLPCLEESPFGSRSMADVSSVHPYILFLFHSTFDSMSFYGLEHAVAY